MAEASFMDRWLDRLSKVFGILLPLVLGYISYSYQKNKDTSDAGEHARQAIQIRDRVAWEQKSKRYENLAALLPLLVSGDKAKIATALNLLESEAKEGLAPPEVQAIVARIAGDRADLRVEATRTLEAVSNQVARDTCRQMPDGIYVHVADSKDQYVAGQWLSRSALLSKLPVVRGVERVEASPDHTEIRYYTKQNEATAKDLMDALKGAGFADVQLKDISASYLKKGCPPPGIFELWFSKNIAIPQSITAQASDN
jgi:hypothetical protein